MGRERKRGDVEELVVVRMRNVIREGQTCWSMTMALVPKGFRSRGTDADSAIIGRCFQCITAQASRDSN